jgi:O-antigen ligase
MFETSAYSFRSGRPARLFDKFAMIPLAAFVFVEIVTPLLHYTPRSSVRVSLEEKLQGIMASRLENKIFWPVLAAITFVLVARNWSRLTLPFHVKWLFAYLAFAGISVLWAFSPEFSFSRYVLQVMIVTSIVLPALLAHPAADMIRSLFLCFAFACVLNIAFVINQEPIVIDNVILGYQGYFSFKGILGECAAIAFLLSLHEMLYSGWRRVLGIVVIAIAIWLVIVSKSKGSFGLAILAPCLAGLTLFIGKKMRVSPAIVLLPALFCYAVLSRINGNLINRISWHLYGNYSLSGRSDIWNFVNFEIAKSPLFGWGYQSFWLVGFNGPSIVDAPGWIKGMPSGHNGYLDTQLEMGYIGLALLVAFIITTLHAARRVADREPARAWLLLTLALYVILTNVLETTWMRGMEPLWLLFLIVAAEVGRYWQHSHPAVPEPIPWQPVVGGLRLGLTPNRTSGPISE